VEAFAEELRFLPFSALNGEGDVAGAVGAEVDGRERVLADVVALLDDIFIDPVIIVDRGTKELMTLLLFL
jgi:hypothetical protein